MPLFCTLKNEYIGTNTPPADRFENRGYPLMFEGKNKHMFFLDPEDTTKTVQKFYGAPLSVAHGALCYNPSLPSGQQYYNNDTGNAIDIFGPIKRFEVGEPTLITFGGSFRMFKKLEVNDHKIDVVSTQVQVQEETQLSVDIGNVVNNPLSHGGKFQVITGLNVQHHKITPNYNQFTLPNETTLSLEGSSSTGITQRTVTVHRITSVSGHTINTTSTVFTIPSTSHSFSITKGSDVADTKITLSNTKGSNTVDTSFNLRYGENISISYNSNVIAISATNTHSVNHTFSATADSNVGKITLNKANSSGTTGTSFTISSGTGISITGSETNLTITNSSTNTDTKCTSEANHYTPSGTEHNGNLVRGITYDSKGHITNIVRTTSVNDIRVVTALPSDAGSYPNTLFLVTGGG